LDIFDQAQEINELFRENALKEHFKKHKIATPPKSRLAMTSKECADCGEPIPKGRLKANPQATRCITCQILAERNGNEDE
jgi:DnaK suppressor protein